VKRSALNFQLGDRKGAWWPGYGDRHGVWTSGVLTGRACPSAGRSVQAGCGSRIWGQTRCPVPDMGTDTVSGIPIRNVQRETFNSQLSTG